MSKDLEGLLQRTLDLIELENQRIDTALTKLLLPGEFQNQVALNATLAQMRIPLVSAVSVQITALMTEYRNAYSLFEAEHCQITDMYLQEAETIKKISSTQVGRVIVALNQVANGNEVNVDEVFAEVEAQGQPARLVLETQKLARIKRQEEVVGKIKAALKTLDTSIKKIITQYVADCEAKSKAIYQEFLVS